MTDGARPEPKLAARLCEDRRMRRLLTAAVVALTSLTLLATPALAADTDSKVDKFNPIVPMLVMLGIGALIFGVAYALDKRKD